MKYTSKYTGAQIDGAIEKVLTGNSDASIDVTAKVGQTIVVKEVDANGKPTAWESAEYQPRTHWEETITIKGETILFDGTTSGKEGVQFEGMQPLYRISDAVCTWEELSSGHIQMKNGEDVFNAVIGEVGGVEILADNVFMPDALPIYVVLEDNAVLSEVYIFPKKGIYAPEYLLAESVTGSITIPDSTTTAIKTLDKKFLPPSHQFGEETITIKGDTLTWDGNTDGLVSVNFGADVYRVSEVTPTMADLTGGAIVKWSSQTEGSECTTENGLLREPISGIIMLNGGAVVIIDKSLDGTDIGNGEPLKAGTYFAHDGGEYNESLTIPGYNGFETTTTVVKKIPPKYLPEHLQFGTETKVVEGDTLIWDGNTEGKVIASDTFVKISNVVLTSDDLENGYKFSCVFDGVTEERELTEYERPNNDMLVICDGGVICVSTDGASIDEFVFPEKGIYIGLGYTEASPVSLTIHGYTGFKTTTSVVKKISPKYLPEGIGYSEKTVILPETTVEIDVEQGNGVIPYDFILEEGKEYTVKYNGVEYIVSNGMQMEGFFVMGNGGAVEEGFPVTNDPFIIVSEEGESVDGSGFIRGWVVIPLDGSTSITLSIIEENVTQISEKYIPSVIKYVDCTLTDSLDSTTLTADTVTGDQMYEWLKDGFDVVIRSKFTETTDIGTETTTEIWSNIDSIKEINVGSDLAIVTYTKYSIFTEAGKTSGLILGLQAGTLVSGTIIRKSIK